MLLIDLVMIIIGKQLLRNGVVPEYHVVDAQINLKIPSFKSTLKAGATNLLGDEYFTAFGTGNIGSMYYVIMDH